jgi:hypothetical protein
MAAPLAIGAHRAVFPVRVQAEEREVDVEPDSRDRGGLLVAESASVLAAGPKLLGGLERVGGESALPGRSAFRGESEFSV